MVKNIPRSLARQIHLSAKIKDSTFNNKFKGYITPKQFYLLKNSELTKLSFPDFISKICEFFSSFGSVVNSSELQRLVQLSNRVTLTLRYLSAKKNGIRSSEYQSILKDLLLIKLESSINFSGYLTSTSLPSKKGSYEPLNFICPVCPDYSYVTKENGRYEYTFKELSSGIGLVAMRAINNAKSILSYVNQLKLEENQLKITILVGDFEANQQNCNSLGETQESFVKKCHQSSLAIKHSIEFIHSGVFTSLCGGLQEWPHILKFVKRLSSLNSFDDLKRHYPVFNHEKSLISRIPLYRRWFNDTIDIEKIFMSQILEYATMGFVIYSHRNMNPILIASDHMAMRYYYTLICPLTIFGSTVRY